MIEKTLKNLEILVDKAKNVGIDRDLQKNYEFDLFYLGNYIADQKHKYFEKKFAFERKRNEDYLKIRKEVESVRTAMEQANKDNIKDKMTVEMYQDNVERLSDKYKNYCRIAELIKQDLINQNVEASRQREIS